MNFPSSPTLNQEYTYAGKTWKYNGTGWTLVTTTGGGGTPGGSTTQVQYNNAGAFAGAANITTNGTYLEVKQPSSASSAVTSTATTTLDCSTASTFRVAMTTNVTTLTLSNVRDGQTVNILFTQDGTGGKTMAWPATFKWPNATTPALSTAANAVDMLCVTYFSTPNIFVATMARGLA